MNNWAANHPEQAEEIARLPPSQQNAAERAAMAPAVEAAERRRQIDLTLTPWHKDVYELARLWRWLELFDELPRDPALFLETALSWSQQYDLMNEALAK